MRRRVGVVVLVLSLFAAGIAAGAIHAGLPLSTTTTDTTTTDVAPPTTTTVPTTTTSPTTTAETTTAATTTVPTTTAPAPPPEGKPLSAAALGTPRCLVLAGFALLEPGRSALALGDVAVVPRAPSAGEGAVVYPKDGSILTASGVSMRGSGCGTGARGSVAITSLSLFGGAVNARSVRLGVRTGVAGKGVAIGGLKVGHTAVAATPGRQVVLGSWGYLVVLEHAGPTQAAALAVHLTKAHAGLPAGAVLLVGLARLAPLKAVAPKTAPAAKTRQVKTTSRRRVHVVHRVHHGMKPKRATQHRAPTQRPGDAPLRVTPHLGVTGYVFPVAGVTDWGDSFGGYRGDVPGNYHHGDDLFAPLGTPVVAVADGTLNRVGWEHIGGWRLWVRDHNRNEFYYAHLSGYSPLALRTKYVKKGEVIGYVGNSGDAFTTPPHLHFEVHPHQLLKLDYNGAVDPTTYLDTWSHVTRPHAPVPQHPPFPAGAVRKEARYIWRELLAARGVVHHPPKPSERPQIAVPGKDHGPLVRSLAGSRHGQAADPVPGARQTSSMGLVDLLAGIVLPALLFLGALAFRLSRDPA
jgi:murein DD-endopeptidase MepM/ murein hydrolase activator NlpD